jgi:DNA-binding PadR family transcriptional regulator
MDSLDLKHAKSLLIALSKVEEAKKSDFFGIIKSHQVLDNLLNSLQKDNYLIIKESQVGPKKYSISLTPKGRSVAEQLKRAEEAAKGVVIHEDESRIEVSDIPEMWREKWKNLHALIHVNVFDDHVTIMETNHEGSGKERIFNIYVRENGQGHLRLWCELDESFDCYHVGYALTLAPVQDMFARVRGGK